ncbi:MAG: MFS transporter [Chitinophagales bacterium]
MGNNADNRRAILLLLTANSISGVAQGISMLAIPWYFAHITHEEGLFTAIYFIVTAISLVWGVYAGTLVDRYNRKHIFLWMNAVGLAILGSISALGYSWDGLPWWAVGMVFATTVFVYNIHFPSVYAFAQEITPKAQYARVTSQLEVQGQITWTISGGAAALLLNGVDGTVNLLGWNVAVPWHFRPWGIHEIFTIDALTYLIAFIMIWRIDAIAQTEKQVDLDPLWNRIITGFDYLKERLVLFLFGNASLMVFTTIIIHSTMVNPMYVEKYLHSGGDIYAMADMVFSMGALLAGLYTAKWISEKHSIKAIILFSALAAVMYFVHVSNTILWLYFVTYFVIGICNAGIRILRVTYIFHHIPNHIIGRAGSVFSVINVSSRLMLTGLFALPLFHQGQNIVYANAVLGGVCLIGALSILAVRRDLEKG